ncbi:restriction endonuclease subunit S [Bacteroides caecimuris]|uniref:restriction endonuclease subunit S n=1 Tax=Bacteroides caecimuris TaxID=1796613 RepID=UPI002570CC8E|nr:restriction endonuclease subunit S [Bacteroides caecimuris]
MANNSNKNKCNVPHLRFPEFSGEWEKNNLSKFSSKITKKNKGNVIQNVLCNSANLGIIPQNDYFDRDIANADNTDSYYIIEQGDFVYNPRKSTAAPYGPVNIYNGEKPGIISPLYLCFSVLNISPSFLFYRFKSSVWHPYVYSHGDTGVRFDRVSIKDDVFFDMPIYTPTQNEQEKIATLLSLIDERIATQNKIIKKYESLIKGIMVELQKQGLKKGTWKKVFLNDILTERNERNSNLYQVFSVSVSQGIINQVDHLGRSFSAKDTSKYNVVHYGDLVYTKSPTGSFPYGIVKQSLNRERVAVSPLYGVYVPNSLAIGVYLHKYFMSEINTHNYLHPLIQKGAKNTINITNQRFLENRVPMPLDSNELLLISKLLRSVNDKIRHEQNMLQEYQKQKQYLLRQMFI